MALTPPRPPSSSPRRSLVPPQTAAAADAAAEPRWQWFCYSNVVAVVVFTVSMTHVLQFWLAHGRLHSAGYAFGQPAFAAAVVGAVASLLYFIAFFGVAFIASDVDSLAADGEPLAAADVDADVVIVGAGTAGASMATVLARQGKRVTLIERCVR